jgi:putative photosynthetic complex assembly protein 2
MDSSLSALWAFGFTLLVWWLGTGVILYLDGLPRYTFKFTMTAASALGLLGLFGIAVSSRHTTAGAAYCAFTCAILVWAWQEVAFLLGWVTGPRRAPCPSELRGWARARAAFQTVVHHEVALLVLGAAVLIATWNQPNQTGWWTFAVLWAMRQSAKLNVFLGVRNASEDFLPPHLTYLGSYFARKPMNALWPVTVSAASFVAFLIFRSLASAVPGSFDAASLALVMSLLSLAIAEHLFLVLPLPMAAIWAWGMRSRVRS